MITIIRWIYKLLPANDWLWIGLVLSIIGFHFITIEDAKIKTRNEVNAEWQQKIVTINAQAKADHDAQQAQIDDLAKSSQPELQARFDSIKGQLSVLVAQSKKAPVVFKSDCVLPADQVSAFNAIR